MMYANQDGYLTPCLTLPTQQNINLNRYGQMRLEYLEQNEPTLCDQMMLAGTLIPNCQQMGLQAEKMVDKTLTDLMHRTKIVFKLEQNGGEQSNEVYIKTGDEWQKVEDATVVMKDAPVLSIDKTDEGGNLLPGAVLTIRNEKDEVIDTWTTDYKTHKVPIDDYYLKLSDEETEHIYTLTEDAAPAGFEVASSVHFKLETVDDMVTLYVRKNSEFPWSKADKRLITMVDKAIPREDTPTPTPGSTPQPTTTPAPTPAPTVTPASVVVTTIPQTGDNSPLGLILALAGISLAGLAVLIWKRRSRKSIAPLENDDSEE